MSAGQIVNNMVLHVLQKHYPSTFGVNAIMETRRSQPKHFTSSRIK